MLKSTCGEIIIQKGSVLYNTSDDLFKYHNDLDKLMLYIHLNLHVIINMFILLKLKKH